jgi:hypothetical protein
MANIPDFTDADLKLARQTLQERYGCAVPIEVADAEIELIPGSGELTTCPVIYWEERGAHFVLFKIAESRYRAQFYYSEAQQYGTGRESFDNLGDCMVTVLQVQSDHERQMQGVSSGITGKDLAGDDYDGPLVI